MKKFGCICFLTLCTQYAAHANNAYFSQLLEQDEPEVSISQGDAANKTRDALLSYDLVEERANYFARKLRRMTFGEYADQVMIVAPFLTGQLEFNVSDIRVYINAHQSTSGLEYRLSF